MTTTDKQQPARILRGIAIDLSVMTVIGVVLALLGPFGSFAQPMPIRFVYWLGLCYAGYACFRPVGSLVLLAGEWLDLPKWGLWAVACIIASIPLTAVVLLLETIGNTAQWPGLELTLTTYAYVSLVGGAITALFNFLDKRDEGATPTHDVASQNKPAPRFIERLSPALGSDLIALEMEDHYVRAHTRLGSELVLMRLRDAMAELDGIDGMQVHRSWWVARAAVEDTVRDGRNLKLKLAGGLEAPVSRTNVQALRDSGWI